MRWLVLRDSLDEMYNFTKKDVRIKGPSLVISRNPFW